MWLLNNSNNFNTEKKEIFGMEKNGKKDVISIIYKRSVE